MLLTYSFIHQIFIHLVYVRYCAVEVPEMNNIQPIMSRGRAMGRVSASLDIFRYASLRIYWASFSERNLRSFEGNLCHGASL